MAERISQSVAKRVPLKAYLSSDHISPGTGLTIAVVISKNGAAFGNPNAGATNATSIGDGWYYVDLDTTDTGTLGPLIVRGTEGTIDPTEVPYTVAADSTAASQASVDALQADVDTIGTIVTAIESQTDDIGTAGAGLAAIPWNASWDAEVQSEVEDALAARFDSARTQPAQGAPAANASHMVQQDFLYKLSRNKLTQDATTLKVFADDGSTVDHKAPVSDNGTTYTRGEIISGP